MYLKTVPQEVISVMQILNSAGYETRLVGGSVRDLVRNAAPKDYDLATQALPLVAKEILKANRITTIDTGLAHGTITAVVQGTPIEITTLRVDTNTDGRHAEVIFTDSFMDDAARRDFTMNGMSIDLNGKLYDYFGGMNDIDKNQIVFIGDPYERIREDYLRVLRMFRFAARFGYSIPALVITPEIKSGLLTLSVERVWSEISKILRSKKSGQVFELMNDGGILEVLDIPYQSESVMTVTSDRTDNPITVLVSQIRTAERFERFSDRYKLSNSERDLGLFLIRNTDRPWSFETLQRMVNVERVSRDYLTEMVVVYQMAIGWVNRAFDSRVAFPLNGYDLISAGYRPGPGLGVELDRLIDVWAQSDYKLTKDDLKSMIKKEI